VRTREALIAFQRQEGFQASGTIDTRTVAALGVSNKISATQNQSTTVGQGQGGQQPSAQQNMTGQNTGQGQANAPAKQNQPATTGQAGTQTNGQSGTQQPPGQTTGQAAPPAQGTNRRAPIRTCRRGRNAPAPSTTGQRRRPAKQIIARSRAPLRRGSFLCRLDVRIPPYSDWRSADWCLAPAERPVRSSGRRLLRARLTIRLPCQPGRCCRLVLLRRRIGLTLTGILAGHVLLRRRLLTALSLADVVDWFCVCADLVGHAERGKRCGYQSCRWPGNPPAAGRRSAPRASALEDAGRFTGQQTAFDQHHLDHADLLRTEIECGDAATAHCCERG